MGTGLRALGVWALDSRLWALGSELYTIPSISMFAAAILSIEDKSNITIFLVWLPWHKNKYLHVFTVPVGAAAFVLMSWTMQ